MAGEYRGACKGSKRCQAMRLALDGGPRAGLVTGFVFPTMAEVILYKPKPRDRGIILNLCPWCGAKLPATKKRAALAAAPEEKP
ncbi:MAG: hypothetical protein ACJ79R_20550 [Anaeromyxobacteraceae bacterium]